MIEMNGEIQLAHSHLLVDRLLGMEQRSCMAGVNIED